METHIVLTAKSPGIGQGRSRDQLLELGSSLELLDDQTDKFRWRRFLHQRDQRLDGAEGQTLRLFSRRDRSQAKVGGSGRAHRGDQHPPSHICNELTPVAPTLIIIISLLEAGRLSH